MSLDETEKVVLHLSFENFKEIDVDDKHIGFRIHKEADQLDRQMNEIAALRAMREDINNTLDEPPSSLLFLMAVEIRDWRIEKGFHTPEDIVEEDDMMLGKLALVHSEVSEASEAIRAHDFENFKEEIADTFIRLLDLCGTLGIDPKKIIDNKMAVNQQREYRHGKETSL